MKSLSCAAFLLCLHIFYATPARSEPIHNYFAFGTFMGTGDATSNQDMRHATGYTLSFDRDFPLMQRTTLGPVIELSNVWLQTRSENDRTAIVSTYDNRVAALGLKAVYQLKGLAFQVTQESEHMTVPEIFIKAVGGPAYSKLTVDENSPTSFKESRFNNINGAYANGELGMRFALSSDFGLQISFLSQYLNLDQNAAQGTYEGEELSEGGEQPSFGIIGPEEQKMEKEITLRTYTGMISYFLVF